MLTSGLSVADADGLHDDDWCWQKVRLRIRAESRVSELRVGVWLKPEPTSPTRTAFSFTSDRLSRTTRFVPYGHPTELSFPADLHPGEEMNIGLECENRVVSGGDQRPLSFSLMSLVLL